MRVLAFAFMLVSAAGAVRAESLVLKDAERFAVPQSRIVKQRVVKEAEVLTLAPPPTCCTGYVGSAYGLGKPNYYGISPRPDDGYARCGC
jgi:hypothetical protein